MRTFHALRYVIKYRLHSEKYCGQDTVFIKLMTQRLSHFTMQVCIEIYFIARKSTKSVFRDWFLPEFRLRNQRCSRKHESGIIDILYANRATL